MSDENTILAAFGMLMAAAVLTPFHYRWRNAKGKAGIHATDESLEEVGLSAIMNLGTGQARPGVDGRLILRPPFGTRILGPLLAAGVLIFFDMNLLFEVVGLTSTDLQALARAVLWALLAYTVFMLNIRQRIIVDGDMLTCRGVQLSTQTRDLSGLVDIRVHPKRPALVLTFADQPRLYIPKFLTGRDTFVPLMEEIAAGNRALGLRAAPEGFMARAGF